MEIEREEIEQREAKKAAAALALKIEQERIENE